MINQRRIFLEHMGQTTPFPLALEIVSADGAFIVTSEGKKIYDLISGIAASPLGHNHPEIKKALYKQAESHLHVMCYGEFIQSAQTELTQLLLDTLPDNLNSIFYVNSGSEAVEGALKLAKRYTKRYKIISARNAYHGSTHGALSVSGEKLQRSFRPLLPGIININFGSFEDLELIDESVASVILETIQGEAGVILPPPDYFKEVRRKCDQSGTLLIVDEIQAGMGRTGSFWAITTEGIVPDILVTAKALGGGLPLGAFIANREVMATLTHNPLLGHITTYGGHPLSCATGAATVKTIFSEGLLANVSTINKTIREKFEPYSDVLKLRGRGLMLALEVGNFDLLKKTIDKCIEMGVLTDWFVFNDTAMRIAPSLNATINEINHACDTIIEAFKLCRK